MLTLDTLVAGLGTLSALSTFSITFNSESKDRPAAAPSPSTLVMAARTVVGLARDAIWTGLAIRCMRDLGGPLPGWFVMSVGLFWLYQLLMTWLTLDIRWHFPSSDPIRAAAFVRRRLGAITLLLSAFPGALGVTAFWLTLLVRFWQR